MKKQIQVLYNRFGVISDRSKNITKNVVLSFLYKGASIMAGVFMVPVTISYLNTDNYGVWLTLSSFVAWFSFFDIGLGNGLRNKFAEAKAKGDMHLARAYVSSAYFTIGCVSLLLIIVFFILNFFIDWSRVFNTDPSLQEDLKIVMPLVFTFFCLQLVTTLITTIYTADQKNAMQGKINFFTQAGCLFAIWLLTQTTKSSLLFFGSIFSCLPFTILLVLNFIAFSKRYKEFKPTITLWRKKYLKDIFGLGFIFFIVQISGIILYATDNFIISKLFSPAEVVPYSIAYKYISISSMAFNIIAAPYWTSITDAYHKADFEWLKRTMKNFRMMSYAFAILIVIMICLSPAVYNLWIGDKVNISLSLSVLIGVFFVLSLYVTPFTIFLNGTGKIKIQAIQSVISALLNIPLSIFFASYMNLGVNGVILSTIVCFLPSVFLAQFQYSRLINHTANGLWNR